MLLIGNEVKQALITLIELVGLKVTDPSPKAVNELLQKEWIKTKAEKGTLRCEIEGRLPTDYEYELLDHLQLLSDLVPDPRKEYNPPIFLGATMKAMARRFQFMKEHGLVSVDSESKSTIYLLAGQRPLKEEQERKELIPSIMEETGFDLWVHDWWKDPAYPSNETEIAKFLIKYGGLHVDCITVDLPKQGDVLPSTYSTAVELFRMISFTQPQNPNYLVVSSQPYCQNQILTVQRAAKEAGMKDLAIDVCGPAAPSDLPLVRILDGVAKQLWEEVKDLD